MSALPLTSDIYEAGWLTTLRSTGVLGLGAMGIAVGWGMVAVVGPLLAPHDPLALSTATLASPSPAHLFGTDELGRDVFSRVIWGARVSLPYAALTVGVSVAFGAVFGGVAGYFGGWLDEILMRVASWQWPLLPSSARVLEMRSLRSSR